MLNPLGGLDTNRQYSALHLAWRLVFQAFARQIVAADSTCLRTGWSNEGYLRRLYRGCVGFYSGQILYPQVETARRFKSDELQGSQTGRPLPCDGWHFSDAQTIRRSNSDDSYKGRDAGRAPFLLRRNESTRS